MDGLRARPDGRSAATARPTHGDADQIMSLRLAEDVQWQLDPLHFLVTLDRFTGL